MTAVPPRLDPSRGFVRTPSTSAALEPLRCPMCGAKTVRVSHVEDSERCQRASFRCTADGSLWVLTLTIKQLAGPNPERVAA